VSWRIFGVTVPGYQPISWDGGPVREYAALKAADLAKRKDYIVFGYAPKEDSVPANSLADLKVCMQLAIQQGTAMNLISWDMFLEESGVTIPSPKKQQPAVCLEVFVDRDKSPVNADAAMQAVRDMCKGTR
jgi:hypothetical protein